MCGNDMKFLELRSSPARPNLLSIQRLTHRSGAFRNDTTLRRRTPRTQVVNKAYVLLNVIALRVLKAHSVYEVQAILRHGRFQTIRCL